LSTVNDLEQIIATANIRTLLQPIFVLSSGRIIGYEALTRGPRGSPLEMPAALFAAAEQANLLADLEHLCRQSALRAKAELLRQRELLFLNIDPRVLNGPDFDVYNARSPLVALGIHADAVVLEVTERITDLTQLQAALNGWKRYGFHIAIDDVGTGHSGLLTLAEIRPHFIKLDMSIIRGVHRDPVRAALIRAMAQFSRDVRASVVAEGIEDGDELAALRELGVDYGQGFFLGQPAEKPLPHGRAWAAG